MNIDCLTGSALAVRRAVSDFVRSRVREGARDLILLVPAQLTLQAERDALACAERGSFRLRVYAPGRLFEQIFAQAGRPREARIDEQGRAMLLYTAAQKHREALRWYGRAARHPGFAARAQKQIETFKQAGLRPDDLLRLADEGDAAAPKLRDIALLYEAYEAALAGRFMDGEDEAARAVARMPDAPFLGRADVFAYGFDLVSPTLARVLIALTKNAASVTLALTCGAGSGEARCYEAATASLFRLYNLCEQSGVAFATRALPEPDSAPGALAHLARHLYRAPIIPYEDDPKDVRLIMARSPREEAELAAATCRYLARARGWRYRDMAVACARADAGYDVALRRAFGACGVPLYLASARGADKHPLSVFLLAALRCVARGYPSDAVFAYLRAGFADLTQDECDRLINYARTRGLRYRDWVKPLRYGDPAELPALDALRARAVAPLLALAERVKQAASMRDLVAAAYGLLEDCRVFDQLEETRRALLTGDMPERAMEGAQVMNRVLAAFDQLVSLLGDEAASLSQLDELLRRALAGAQVRDLPQAGDAVEGGALDRLKGKPVRALIVVGASDAGEGGADGLLDARETARIAEASKRWLGLSDDERASLRRMSLKEQLASVDGLLLVTWPQSDVSGAALHPAPMVAAMRAVLPRLRQRGGVTRDEALLRLLLESPGAALLALPAMLRDRDPLAAAARAALDELPDFAPALARMDAAMAHRVRSEQLSPALARSIYGSLSRVSATRLEGEAACPFAHFVKYGLRPEPFKPFELTPRDAGTFYHDALLRFVESCGDTLSAMDADAGAARMDEITETMLDGLRASAMGEGAVAEAEGRRLRGVARRAARIVTSQFRGSQFTPMSAERQIEEGDARADDAAFTGRIDRVDAATIGGVRYLRVIDYKTGGRSVSLSDMAYGLQLQLSIYLATATRQFGGVPAGAFYCKVDDPVLITESRDPAEVEAAREKALRLEGLSLADPRVVRAMADMPERVANVAFNKDGSLRASEKLLDADAFGVLTDYARQCAAALRAQILSGDTEISPAASGQWTACAYCDHAAVCGFEAGLDGADARALPRLTGAEALEQMRTKIRLAGADAPALDA